MAMLSRIKRIISANINGLIEKAEDPEILLNELIREMDDNIIKMRNEIVKSIALEKRFARQIENAGKKIRTWEENSEKAIRDGNDDLARKALFRKLQEERMLPELIEQHKKSASASTILKDQLRLLEDKVQDARRRKELLIARKQAARTHQSMLNSTGRFVAAAKKSDALLAEADLPTPGGFESLEDEVLHLETEADALREVMYLEPSLDKVFEQSRTDEKIEHLLQELKEKYRK
jgi:phage shock protein A